MASSPINNLSAVQDKIDSMKESMSDNDYLELCNLMKDTYNVEKEKDEAKLHTYQMSFFEPVYLKNSDHEDRSSNQGWRMRLNHLIFKMREKKYKQIDNMIQTHGYFDMYYEEENIEYNPFSNDNSNMIYFVNSNEKEEELTIYTDNYIVIKIFPV